MEVKLISDNEFDEQKGNRGYNNIPQKGTLNGDFNDFLEFLNWTLESNHNNNSENLKEAIKIFGEKYKMSMTTKFLRNLMNKSHHYKNDRIRYLLNQIGMTTETINRYFYSVINVKMKLKEFGTDKTYSVGHSYRKLDKEQMELLVDKEQHEQKMAKIKKNFEEMEKQKPKEMEKPKIARWRKDEKVVFNKEKESQWKTEEIVKWLKDNKGKCFEVPIEEFCDSFRKDRKNISGTSINFQIEKLRMPIECRTSKDKAKFWVKE